MATRPTRTRFALLAGMLVVGSVGCGETPTESTEPPTEGEPPANVAPALAAIPDQAVIRNALVSRSVEVALSITDPDDTRHSVVIESSDESVLSGSAVSCGPGPCVLTLSPVLDATATVTLSVQVADDDGADDRADFVLRVEPRRVTSTADLGPGSLRSVLDEAEAGDVIGFDAEGAFASGATISLLTEIEIDRSVTIEGPGQDVLTVSGNNVTRAFRIAGQAAATILDLTIADGVAGLEPLPVGEERRVGGGALVMPGGALTLKRVRLNGNQAELGGGVANFDATLLIEESSVSDNDASGSGGGIYFGGDGAGSTRLVSTRLAGNDAAEAGGGLASIAGPVAISGGRIERNTALSGAGLSVGGVTTVSAAEIVDNRAEASGGGAYFFGAGAVVESTLFQMNEAAYGGGACVCEGTDVTMSGVSIDANQAISGAGVYVFGTFALRSGSELSDNVATEFGGGLVVNLESSATLEESVLRGNDAEAGGGLFAFGEVLVARSLLEANTANYGGGAHVIGAPSTFSSTTLRANRADFNGGGLRVVGSDAPATMENSEILDNSAGAWGGGIELATAGGVTHQLSNTVVSENKAAFGGGLLASSSVDVVDTHFIDNEATQAGGGIHTADRLVVTGVSRISQNSARLGAGIHASRRVTLGEDSSVAGNRAAERGGGFYLTSTADLDVLDQTSSLIVGNSAGIAGGGIYNAGGDIRDVDPRTVLGNAPDDIAEGN